MASISAGPAPTPIAAPGRLGRFELREVLGRGAQGVVYRALDPMLGREVAIKTLRKGRDETALLREARIVGGLRHPNIVPVFEAGRESETPFIVYELIAGDTLRATIAERGAIALGEALGWTLGILDGLDCAHRAGIVHRDLNPANVLIASDASARIMDFGISVANGAPADPMNRVVGTASYLAPEQLAAGDVTAATDVFAVGLTVIEMLCGAPAINAEGGIQAMYRIAHEPIAPPSERGVRIDPKLESVVMRALEKSPRKRFQSALEFREALERFLPGRAEGITTRAENDASTLSFLLRRMRRNKDFPAIAANVAEIRRQTSTGADSTVSDIANVILRDYALSTKLLKLVNSSYYGQYGGQISTVSRAVVILGLEGVRTAAMSLLLFEHLESKGNADLLKDSAARGFLSGAIGRAMAASGSICDPEETFVCGMLRGLGRYLTIYYLPEEYAEIARAVEETGVDEGDACRQVLGIGYEELGAGVAREWQLPSIVVDSIAEKEGARDEPPRDRRSAMRVFTSYANDLCDAIVDTPDGGAAAAVARIHRRYAGCAPVPEKSMQALLESAIGDAREFGEAAGPGFNGAAAMRIATAFADGEPNPAQVHAKPIAEQPPADAHEGDERRALLMSGIQDITNALLDNTPVNDVLVMVLETMFRGIGFTRVIFCISDRKRGRMVARFGLGKGIDEMVRRFYFDLNDGSDAFATACRSRQDLVFPSPGCMRQDIPVWHREIGAAGSFVILPVAVNNVTVGLIYCDFDGTSRKATPGDLNYLNTLRNQAALAVKQRR